MSEWKTDFDFSGMLVAWQKRHGRHTLPWQRTRDAYRIWLSEIMLQQTQVATVIPYYARFLERFPDISMLAFSSQETVMAEWSGLGYYFRARNLHRCAQLIMSEYHGQFPTEPDVLEKLPGIGRSTAAAISVFSSGKRAAILDGNVIRVLSRIFGIIEYAGSKKIKDRLWELAESLLPQTDLEAYTQGLMDLGATVCTRSNPSCSICPFNTCCFALAKGKIKELPVKKPAKKIPERGVFMFIFVYQGRVLLEKRPEFGIWGGLFSLPEKDNAEFATDLPDLKKLAQPFGKLMSHELLKSFTHVFTHFRLRIQPVLVNLSYAADMLSSGKYIWYEFDQIKEAPLPTPVKKLLFPLAEKRVSKDI